MLNLDWLLKNFTINLENCEKMPKFAPLTSNLGNLLQKELLPWVTRPGVAIFMGVYYFQTLPFLLTF